MKKLKTVIWIIVLVLLQTAFEMLLSPFGITIPLLTAFAASAAFLENGFGAAFGIGIICGIIDGALFKEMFSVSVFVSVLLVIGIFNFRNKPRYAGDLPKLSVWTLAAVFCGNTVSDLIKLWSAIAVDVLLKNAVSGVLGAIFAAVIYVLLKKTVYTSNYKTFIL